MAGAIEDWHDKKYKRFGEQLGDLIRETVVVTFPQTYRYDEEGHLREIRVLEYEASYGSLSFVSVAAAACMVAMSFALMALRSRKRSQHVPEDVLDPLDPEFGDEAAE